MSRITDYILEPKVVYTEGGFLVRVKVIDDYKYKKYIVSENLHYKTVQGTSFTLTDADTTKQAEITEIRGKNGKNLLGLKTYSNNNFNTREYVDISSILQIKSNYGIATEFECGNSFMNVTLKNQYDNAQGLNFHDLKPNTQYTISCNMETNITSGNINIFGQNRLYSETRRIVTFTTNADGIYTTPIHTYIQTTKSAGLYINLSNIQLEEGNQATAFEPYSVVSGDNNIVVSNKNLINIADRSGTISNFYYYDIPTNYLLEEGQTYTVSYDAIVSLEPFNVSVGAGTTGYQRDIKTVTGNVSGRISITFTPNAYQLALGNKFYIRVPRYNTPQTSNYEIKNIQLEKGNVATEYTQHKGVNYLIDLKGKNLFNDILRQGVTIYNTGVWGASNSRITSTDWIKNVKAGTYTISAKTSTTKTLQVSMVTFNTSGVFNNVSGVSGQWKTMPFTFTIPIDMNLKCNISYTNNSNITPSEVTEMQLESGTVATEYSPSNPTELTENDKLWNNNGTWQLNDTAITDNYLLTQLQALENIELYEDLCYVDWVGNVKADMSLQYAGTEDLGIKYIITEDGKKIRTDWRKLGRRKKWMMK